MSVKNQHDILQEITVSLRNQDILTTTQRGVTTTTSTGALSGSRTITLPYNNVKNVRSVTIGSTALAFGSEYSVTYTGTAIITLAVTATDSYTTQYDYGTDTVFFGYPRNEIVLDTKFPRIAVEYIDMVSEAGGFGNVNLNRHDFTITVYDKKNEDVRTHLYGVRNWVVTKQNSLYNLKLIKPTNMGPLVIAGEFVNFKDKIMKQNQDFTAWLDFESN